MRSKLLLLLYLAFMLERCTTAAPSRVPISLILEYTANQPRKRDVMVISLIDKDETNEMMTYVIDRWYHNIRLVLTKCDQLRDTHDVDDIDGNPRNDNTNTWVISLPVNACPPPFGRDMILLGVPN
jgi:hypothetical protein